MAINNNQAYRDFISKPINEQKNIVLNNICLRNGGHVVKLPNGGQPPLSQEKLSEIFKASAKERDERMEMDFSEGRIILSELSDNGNVKKMKYPIACLSSYMVHDGKAYDMVTGKPEIPMKIRRGKLDSENDRDILVGRIKLSDDKSLYFEPDLFIALCLLDRKADEHKDAVHMVTYDRSQGMCAQCRMVALPDCTAPYSVIEAVKMLTNIIGFKEGGEIVDGGR